MRKGRDSREARSNNEAIVSENIEIVFADLRRLRGDEYQSLWRVWEFKGITNAIDDVIISRNRFTSVQESMWRIDWYLTFPNGARNLADQVYKRHTTSFAQVVRSPSSPRAVVKGRLAPVEEEAVPWLKRLANYR
jgi:hypothetical protein